MNTACLRALLAAGLLLSAACRRSAPPEDLKVANHLLAVLDFDEQPMIHGRELAQLSAELPKYQRLLAGWLFPGEKEDQVREMLAFRYTRFCYDDEALLLLRDGLNAGQLHPYTGLELAVEAAFIRDLSMLEKARKLAASQKAVLSNAVLDDLARGEVAKGLWQAQLDLQHEPDISLRLDYRALLARLMALDAANPKPADLKDTIFDVPLLDFLRGGDWNDFVRRFSNDQHDILHTETVENLVRTMGSAAEYYAKLGDETKRDEWLQRLADVSGAYRKKNHLRKAAWVDYLIARVKNMPGRPVP